MAFIAYYCVSCTIIGATFTNIVGVERAATVGWPHAFVPGRFDSVPIRCGSFWPQQWYSSMSCGCCRISSFIRNCPAENSNQELKHCYILLESVLLLLHERHRVIFVTKVLYMWLPTYVRGPTKSLFMLSWYVPTWCDPLFLGQQLMKLHEIGEIAHCTELSYVPEDICGSSTTIDS